MFRLQQEFSEFAYMCMAKLFEYKTTTLLTLLPVTHLSFLYLQVIVFHLQIPDNTHSLLNLLLSILNS